MEQSRDLNRLLTIDEVSKLLNVKRSWLYGRTRLRGSERLPHTRVGRYVRFSPGDIEAILRQSNPERG